MNLKGYSIGILEYAHCIDRKLWSIRNLQKVWEKAGAKVVQYSDLSRPAPDVDVWFCHLDSTLVPKDFTQFIKAQPRVVNGSLDDIRKTSFSEQLIDSADSSYKGAVIVKSDYNYGGVVDVRMVSRQRGWVRLLPQKIRRKRLGLPKNLKVNESYTVYDSLKLVPPECFCCEHTVVEKFLPERDGDNYALRMTFMLGKCAISYKMVSSEKVVKNRNVIAIEKIETDPRVVSWAAAHSVEYGKIDHVLHDGKSVIFDINRTPGISGASEENQQILANALAPGIRGYLS